ncbi:MAG: hypothetical protein ACLPWF_27055 [Bryobacteraceae bacterium]|jgi:hypothetical protein
MHTPGPWEYLPDFDGTHWTGSKSVFAEDRSEICVTTRGGQEAANVLLIAAAPELLEALKRIDTACNTFNGVPGGELQAIARAAIAKAEAH